MARWLKAAVKGRRWRELAARLGWMTIVGLLIYGVQHLPVSMEWKIAIGEGIGIFGGVELILDVIAEKNRGKKCYPMLRDRTLAVRLPHR